MQEDLKPIKKFVEVSPELEATAREVFAMKEVGSNIIKIIMDQMRIQTLAEKDVWIRARQELEAQGYDNIAGQIVYEHFAGKFALMENKDAKQTV